MPKNWADLPDEKIIEMRICDLDLSLEGSAVQSAIAQLYKELNVKGLSLKPLFYLSDEWFSPEDTIMISIPFYLAHQKLRDIEKKMMLEVEGGDFEECLKFLRHETGHVIAHAYQLHRKRKWQNLFGLSSQEYDPENYDPKPYSKNFVRNLTNFYAQSHPDEDFAETFAVWLSPKSDWKNQYAKWKAYEKLLYMDKLMKEIATQKPVLISKAKLRPVHQIKARLINYYKKKQYYFGSYIPSFYDKDLLQLFSLDSKASTMTAGKFLDYHGKELRNRIAQWTGVKKYTIGELIKSLTKRCEDLHLMCKSNSEKTKFELSSYLTTLVTNYKHTGTFK
ncbi:MAG: putative zinc-binding metallopeptidase [Deltaproteobacteria bacterium]|nr:putative zinc-binding metallopeptidase [Deltaproteobacteria bacterium]